MKTNLRAKLIQHFVNKKGNKGFTLIELLVVVIIIGILAAVALPSMLNQANRARQSAAQSQVGAVNRAQQAYRLEEPEFADTYAQLQIADASTDDYNIALDATNNDADSGEVTAVPIDTGSGLSAYRGCVSVDAATGTTDSDIAENAGSATAPAAGC